MKALIYHGPGKITCESLPDPVLHDDCGAVVKTTLCAICGSDLHPYHVDLGRPAYSIGHEAVGEVVELGRAVKNFAVGDRVLLTATLSCGRCKPCLEGRTSLCESYPSFRALGQSLPGIGGAQAEGIAVPTADYNLVRLPDDLTDEVGLMLTDTLGTAWMASRRARIGPGDVVAVIGLGAVGLQVIMCALAMGAARVLAIDLLADRRRHAVALGAEALEDPDVIRGTRELTQGVGPDVVIDSNGGPITTQLSIDLVRRGGRVSNVGISEQFTVPFPIKTATAKNLEFHTGICSAQLEVPHLLRELARGTLNKDTITRLFTHRMGLTAGTEAYAFFDQRKDGVLKIALDPSR